ncbi:bleomycin resistance protein [Sphaerisporangium cinnabarinum]|nr:VOC family protein [Sphaerisporangium cinnabarinum]PTU55942.1 bleomycin resistance protein [Sphaerisporangium cinnabarinum]
MSVQTTPHLNFRGDARAALELYRSVFGGELVVTTCGDLGQAADPAAGALVVWGQVSAPSGFRVMAYDVPADRPWSPGEAPFFVSVRGDDVEEVRRCWDALVDGSTVVAPLASSDWAPAYGMLTDRFGVTWVLDVAAPR